MSRSFAPSGTSRRILLVADDEKFRDWSESALCDAGYSADSEANAEGAWSALRQRGYELLVIDHRLPGRSGLRFTLRLRSANLTLPVVLITDAALPFAPQEHRSLHAVTVLPRPFGVEHLLTIVLATFRSARPWAHAPTPARVPLLEAGTVPPRHPVRAVLRRLRLSPAPALCFQT